MAKTDFKAPDEYIRTLPANVQEILRQVRQAIQEGVPEAEEVISYQIPAFKYHGWVFYVSAYAKHFSLSCPPDGTFREVFKNDLAKYKQSKSAIQFPLNEPAPLELIKKMSAFRAKENLERAQSKPKKK
jgi:uncharacterized protein YdhG (YjbR/CyaY superfamily)